MPLVSVAFLVWSPITPSLFPEAPPQRDEVGPQSSFMDFLISPAQAGDLVPPEMLRLIEDHEGRRTQTYTDTEGFRTVGVGFNLDRAGARSRIRQLGVDFDELHAGNIQLTNDQIDQLFMDDVVNARQQVVKIFPDISNFSPTRQAALTDMLFNLGFSRLKGFQKMIKAANKGDWEKAADEAKNSRWFNQVGRRGPRIVEMLRNG